MAEAIDLSKRKFLIVDDETFVLGLLERILRQFKATAIIKAKNGIEALKSIRDDVERVDCIIADFNMKPMNGLQLLQAVRMGANSHIPRDQGFVMLTGHGESDTVTTAVMLDVNGYIIKPVAPDKLSQVLERVFKRPIELRDVDYYRSIDLGLKTGGAPAKAPDP